MANPNQPHNSSASQPQAAAPFKLKFKLGGVSASASASASSSSNASPAAAAAAPASTSTLPSPIAPSNAASTQPGSTANSTGSLAGPTTASTAGTAKPPPAKSKSKVTVSSLPADNTTSSTGTARGAPSPAPSVATDADKPKRKRPARRPPGEAGPGKHWRRGLKGTIVAGQVDTYQIPAAARGEDASGSPTPLHAPGTATPSAAAATAAAASKNVYGFSKSAVVDYRTPKSRKWTSVDKEITTVSGKTIKLRTWTGEPTSDYADMRLRNPVPVAGPGATSAGTANAPSRVPPPVIRQVVPLRENVSSLPRVSAAQTGAAPVVVKTEPMQVDTA